jgi:ankyrin repeat protein
VYSSYGHFVLASDPFGMNILSSQLLSQDSMEASPAPAPEEESVEECAICTNSSEELLISTPCHHKFHLSCLMRWNHTQARRGAGTTCPICRVSLLSTSFTGGSATSAPSRAVDSLSFSFVTPAVRQFQLPPLSFILPQSRAPVTSVQPSQPLVQPLTQSQPQQLWLGQQNQQNQANSETDPEEALDLLMEKIADGDIEGMQECLLHDARVVRTRCEDGTSALHHCVGRSDIQGTELLLSAGANPRSRSNYGMAPLHIACCASNVTIAEKLVARGACVDVTDNMGNTPLHMSVQQNDADMVYFLLGQNAQVEAVNAQGNTVSHIAAKGVLPTISAMLFQARPALDQLNYLGETPLHIAVKNNNTDYCRRYLAQNVFMAMYTRNLHGLSPLDMVNMSQSYALKSMFEEAQEDESDENDEDDDDDDEEDQDFSASVELGSMDAVQ